MQIVIATNNKHKIDEYRKIFPSIDFLSLEDEGIKVDAKETGKTFEENSLIKALAVSMYTNKIILADDSGLIIDSLPGILGVYSHRFMSETDSYNKKATKILEMLENKDRKAHFECVITILNLVDKPLVFKGRVDGRINDKIEGTGGFGYDIIFVPDGYDHTFASMDEKIKNSLSHRADATKKMVEYLKKEGLL